MYSNKEADTLINRIKSQMTSVLDSEIVQKFFNKLNADELTNETRQKIVAKLEELRFKHPISFAVVFPDWFTSLPKTEVVFYLNDDLRRFLEEIDYKC
jgi:hypothetical protein